jgi:hypothetical protein
MRTLSKTAPPPVDVSSAALCLGDAKLQELMGECR